MCGDSSGVIYFDFTRILVDLSHDVRYTDFKAVDTLNKHYKVDNIIKKKEKEYKETSYVYLRSC